MTQHRGARYSADEILLFARSNRGYGLERMIKMIYFENGTKKAQNQSRYFTDALGVLMKHNESSSEDLYACIQDPEMTILEVNNVLRGVMIPKGEFEFSMIFKPKDIKYGQMLTYFSLIMVLGLIIVPFYRRK